MNILAYFSSTSHPLPEAGTENMISFLTVSSPVDASNNEIRLIRIYADGTRKLIQRIPVHRTPYMHSFGMTKNYAVIFATPMYTDNSKIMKTASPAKVRKSHADSMPYNQITVTKFQ